MSRWIVMALALAGCDQAFGLAHVEQSDEHTVQGAIAFRYVGNDASFAPVIDERVLARANVAIDVALDDGTRPSVDYRDDGTFSFARSRADQHYRVQLAIDGVRSELAHDTADLRLGHFVAGRVDRRPLQATRIELPYPEVAASGAYIASTGIYTYTSTNQRGPTVSFDWRLAAPAGSAVTGMLDMTKHDRVYAYELERVEPPSAPPFQRIRSVSSASITQVANGVAALPAPAAIEANTCMRVAAAGLAFHSRLIEAAPRAYTASSGNWFAYMAPVARVMGLTGALWVAYGSFAPVQDLDIAPEFHDPYAGMTLIATASVSATFQVQPPNSSALSLANAIRVFDEAERGTPGACTPTVTTLSSTVGLAGNVTLDGIALENDGQTVTLAVDREVEISWSAIAPGPIDISAVTLYELVPVEGVTTIVSRWSAAAAGSMRTRLAANALQPGHAYMVLITTVRGRPSAAAGDLVTFALPLEHGQIWSTWFEVEGR